MRIRSLLPVPALVALMIAVSMVLAGVASTLALARGGVGNLDADLSALIDADYSVDGGDGLAPLDPRLIDDARQDESELQNSASGIQLVQVFRTTPYEGFVADDEPPSAVGAPGSTATSTPKPGTTPHSNPGSPGDPGGTTPPGGSPAPTPTPAPAPGTTKTPTPTPAPGNTAVPTATPTPTPTPKPANQLVYYLHNNPSPPNGNTTAQAVLPMNTIVPTASTLYNYDTFDSEPGRFIQKGGSGASETSLSRYQVWRGPELTTAMTLQGSVTVELWTAIKGFDSGERGVVHVYLFDRSDAGATPLKSATLDLANWQGGSSTFVLSKFTLTRNGYVMAAGHSFEIKVIVANTADDDMWFAYDTAAYKSQVVISNPG